MMDRSHTITQADGAVEVEYLDVSWNAVRRERDAALAESDWRALKDVVLPNPWKVYRTFLRDLPQNFDSANDAADSWAAYDIPE
jgi:hypothetical protein